MDNTHACTDTCEPGARRATLAIDIIPFNGEDLSGTCKHCSLPREADGRECCRECVERYGRVGRPAPTVEELARVLGASSAVGRAIVY